MTLAVMSIIAPRLPLRIGARARWGIGLAMRLAACALFMVGALGRGAVPALAQEPPDSVQAGDTLAVADSLATEEAATHDQEADSIAGDTIFYNLPTVESRIPAGFVTGIWEWDRDDIMASGANSLTELFQDVPGLITLLGGDYGTPASMSAFSQGGAGYRLVRDGFEVYAFEGGVVDLQSVGLGGIERVRLDRSMGQMIVEMWSHEYDDGRSFSNIEVGTGDLDTNMFRGLYADPTALGGSLGVALERVDTRGRIEGEGGNRTGTWFRYQRHVRDRGGVALEYRRMGTQTKVSDFTPTTNRTDVTLRATARLADGVVVEAYTGKSSYDVEVGPGEVSSLGGTRTQHGFRLGLDSGNFFAKGAFRLFEGDLPSRSLDASGGFTRVGWGGVSGRVSQASFNGVTASSVGGRAWIGPTAGVTLFGAYETGDFGSRDAPVQDEPGATPLLPPTGIVPGIAAITDRTTYRLGASISGRGMTLSGAALFTESDVALPLGIELDLGSPTDIGVDRRGFEGEVILPTMWDGLRLQGSYQRWDRQGPFLPKQIYRGSFEFHDVLKETGTLELWASLGVRGHDPMLTFVADDGAGGPGGLATVPFFQDWYGRIQVRIVTLRVFIRWENFTLRRNNQNFPERRLPVTRTMFGIRWDLWN